MPVPPMTPSKKTFSTKEQQMIEFSCHALKEIGNHLIQGTFQNTYQGDIQPTPSSTPKFKKNLTPINSNSNGIPQSLFSLVSPSASALNKGLNVPEMPMSWHQAILPLAELLKEIGEQLKFLQEDESQQEEAAKEYDIQAKRLLTRYVSVKNTLAVYADRLNNDASEASLTEKLEQQLEQDEQQWELQMAERQQSLVVLQQELERLQNQTEEEEEEEEIEEEEHLEKEDKELVEDLKSENESLKELLALRMEEKNDLLSVYTTFSTKKKRLLEEEEYHKQEENTLKKKKLVEEKKKLETTKILLQEETIQAEQILLQEEKKDQEMLEMKSKIDTKKKNLQEILSQIEKHKQKNLAYKIQMKQMIQQALRIKKKEEAMILFLLDENHGEMNMNELKQLVAEQMVNEDNETTNNATVIRAMYSLVANGLAHIDRTGGNGIVSSLIV